MFVVNPGEMVWLPDQWLHMTLNIDDALYVYRASCQDDFQLQSPRSHGDAGPVARSDPALHVAAARRVCNVAGRFCRGYCHYFCERCDARQCDCAALQE